jgi:hypothetical protein
MSLPFDASRSFVVRARELLAAGTRYQKGDAFNKDSVNPRILRQIFDSRQIGYGDDPAEGMIKLDPLLGGKAGRRGTKAPKPSDGELEQADRLAGSRTKPQLLELAEGIEGVRKEMNKKAIALAVIRAGRGAE